MSTGAGSSRNRGTRFRNVLLLFGVFAVVLVWIYTGSLIGVEDTTVAVYEELQRKMVEEGHKPSFFVISGRRFQLDNKLLATFGGAARKSRHLKGDAIDIVVLDVNRDGAMDGKDVDIVYRILDQELIADRGGVGTYKGEAGFFSRQMVHFDLRGTRARWNR